MTTVTQITTDGLSMASLLMLPNEQRKIVQWLIKQPQSGVTLLQITAHFGVDEFSISQQLSELVESGFVQEIPTGDDISYRIQLATKRGIHQGNLKQALAPGSPLAVILNPSFDSAVTVGSSLEIYVTVTNKGAESALVDVFLEEISPPLLQWCNTPRQKLALGANSSSEVLLRLEVPVTATPGAYQYQIIVDAPQHYPEDTPIRYRRNLQVLPTVETVVRSSDPTITLLPQTSSLNPVRIPSNGTQQISIKVHNRSDRVDKFRLTCPDLDPSWYKVLYPEGLETVGLVSANLSLDLNPGEKGEITLIFQPPQRAVAGLYYPSVRLYSVNNPDLVLLDVVYIEILPLHLLNVELLTIVGKVKRHDGVFHMRLTNVGNATRQVHCRVMGVDEDDTCTYTVTPESLQILPGEKNTAQIVVKPVKWWRQPLFGAARLLNFRVELEDLQNISIPNSTTQATLVWETRPLWQFLLVLLATLGTLGCLIFIIWALFFRPPAPIKIGQFSASDSLYLAANDDLIRLNWQIRNPKQLQKLVITGLSPEGTPVIQPITYKFQKLNIFDDIPDELKSYCKLEKALTCVNVPTEARKAGDYFFEIKAFTNKSPEVPADTVKTGTIKIISEPPPQITELSSGQIVYQEIIEPVNKLNNKNNQNEIKKTPNINLDTILLNWKVNNLEKIKELQVIGRSLEGVVNSPVQKYDLSNGLPLQLKPYCAPFESQLVCRNVPTNSQGAGNYIFELTSIPKGADLVKDTKKTDVIQVKPAKSKILEFQLDGKNAPIKYLVPLNSTKPTPPIKLTWKVSGSKNIKVQLIPAPGLVGINGAIMYPISQESSSETITLQVTNAAGETITRSVTIQTFIPKITPKNPAENPSKNTSKTPSKTSPSPTQKQSLPKLEPVKPKDSKPLPVIPPPPSVTPPSNLPLPPGSGNSTTTPSTPTTNTSPANEKPSIPKEPETPSPIELPPTFN